MSNSSQFTADLTHCRFQRIQSRYIKSSWHAGHSIGYSQGNGLEKILEARKIRLKLRETKTQYTSKKILDFSGDCRLILNDFFKFLLIRIRIRNWQDSCHFSVQSNNFSISQLSAFATLRSLSYGPRYLDYVLIFFKLDN